MNDTCMIKFFKGFIFRYSIIFVIKTNKFLKYFLKDSIKTRILINFQLKLISILIKI